MNDENAKELGRIVRQARRRRRLKRHDIEALTGIPIRWIRDLEYGSYRTPAPDRLLRLADELQIPLPRIERLGGPLGSPVIDWRLALEAQERLTSDEIRQIEQVVRDLKRRPADDQRAKAA